MIQNDLNKTTFTINKQQTTLSINHYYIIYIYILILLFLNNKTSK